MTELSYAVTDGQGRVMQGGRIGDRGPICAGGQVFAFGREPEMHTLAIDLPDGSLLCVPLQWEQALPEGLYRRNGRLEFACTVCDRWAEWPLGIDEWDPDSLVRLCGGSPRCCP